MSNGPNNNNNMLQNKVVSRATVSKNKLNNAKRANIQTKAATFKSNFTEINSKYLSVENDSKSLENNVNTFLSNVVNYYKNINVSSKLSTLSNNINKQKTDQAAYLESIKSLLSRIDALFTETSKSLESVTESSKTNPSMNYEYARFIQRTYNPIKEELEDLEICLNNIKEKLEELQVKLEARWKLTGVTKIVSKSINDKFNQEYEKIRAKIAGVIFKNVSNNNTVLQNLKTLTDLNVPETGDFYKLLELLTNYVTIIKTVNPANANRQQTLINSFIDQITKLQEFLEQKVSFIKNVLTAKADKEAAINQLIDSIKACLDAISLQNINAKSAAYKALFNNKNRLTALQLNNLTNSKNVNRNQKVRNIQSKVTNLKTALNSLVKKNNKPANNNPVNINAKITSTVNELKNTSKNYKPIINSLAATFNQNPGVNIGNYHNKIIDGINRTGRVNTRDIKQYLSSKLLK